MQSLHITIPQFCASICYHLFDRILVLFQVFEIVVANGVIGLVEGDGAGAELLSAA
jgi:hypothetical protein